MHTVTLNGRGGCNGSTLPVGGGGGGGAGGGGGVHYDVTKADFFKGTSKQENTYCKLSLFYWPKSGSIHSLAA